MSSALQPLAPASSSAAPPTQAMEEGAEWFALLRSGEATDADRQQWRAWLAAAAAHRQAWAYVEAVSQGFTPLQASVSREDAGRTLMAADRMVRQRRRLLAGLAVAATGGALGWSAWRQPGLREPLLAWAADQRTAVGEVRQVALPDQSQLWLNTASAVNLHFGAALRQLVLVRGEVLVHTAADDAGRPFVVDSREGRLQALGTRFSVRQEDGQTLLSVFEGAVRVRPRHAPHDAQDLRAGEQGVFDASGLLQRQPLAGIPPAWPNRMLAVQDMTLRELAQELNRYWRGHIGVADEVAGLRVMGSFPLQDMDAVLRALEANQPVRIRRPFPGWVRIQARSP